MKNTALCLSFVAGLLFSLLAGANTIQQTTQTNQPAASVSNSDLKKFANANKELRQIQQNFQQKLKANQGQQAAQEMQKEALKKMAKVIENNGLSTEQYKQIAQSLQHSKKLQEKFQKLQ